MNKSIPVTAPIAGEVFRRELPTISIIIGNSDDRLTQKEWSNFVSDMRHIIERLSETIHMEGFPKPDQPRQNACWIVTPYDPDKLKEAVKDMRAQYKQFAAAWIEAPRTEFI